MKQTRYAVVIVTYNREELLRKCVRQVNIQSIPACKVVIVNNASTDGTSRYLKYLSLNAKKYQIVECAENIGGAGGFAKGIAQASQYDVDYILIIDDDALLSPDYMEKIFKAHAANARYHAFAGSVKSQGKIDLCHRRMILRAGLFFRDCPVAVYQNPYFECEIASFCGMVIERSLVTKIGLPHAGYFIWHDDAEYSLRIHKYSNFLVATDAVLDHRTQAGEGKNPRRYEWRDYYRIRNRILLMKEHGNLFDQMIDTMDLFVRVIFRNWLFGILKIGNYDWNYEKWLVRKAIHDVKLTKIEQYAKNRTDLKVYRAGEST